MARTQLHKLKMTPGTMAEDYMAQLEMLMGRTGFNNAALEDIYIWGLPNSILRKIFTQVTLPNGLTAWKMVLQNLDHLHQSFTELRQSTGQVNPIVGHMSQKVAMPNHRLLPPPVSPHMSQLAYRHQILSPLWTSTFRRHDLKLGSAATARKLDTLQTTTQSLISSRPKTNFWRRTSWILSPKP